jgi:hypothetical protein
MNVEMLTSALVANYVKRATSRDISNLFESGAKAPLNGMNLEQIYESHEMSRSNMNSDPVSGVTTSIVIDYLKRSNHLELSRMMGCEPCLDLQGLTLENLYNHFKPTNTELSQDFDTVRHSGQIVKHLCNDQRFVDTSGDIQAKSYIKLVSLNSTFHQHIGDLRPLENEMDKIVLYIFSKKVQTLYLNLIMTLSQLRGDLSIKQKYPMIKIGRFTSCKGGEKEVTSKAWERLMIKSKIKEPQKVAAEIMALKSRRGMASKWRLIVIGSYLSRSLPTIRHAIEVLTVTLNTIYPKHNIGTFTIEEDELILNEVEQHGAIPDTWQGLCIKLNRSNQQVIFRRYETIASRKSKKSGHWSLIECKALIDCIFPNANLKTVEYINNITVRDIINSGTLKCINRTEPQIRKHWESFLKSILLRFHYGRLSTPWKYKFLKYLVRNKIMGQQEINWDQVSIKFPGIVCAVVASWVPSLDTTGKFKGEPLFKIAEAAMPRFQNRPECGKIALQFHEEIVKHYSENIEIRC